MLTPEQQLEKEVAKQIRRESKDDVISSEGLYFFKPALHIDHSHSRIFVSVPVPITRFAKGVPILDTQTLTVSNNDTFFLEKEALQSKGIFPINIPSLPFPSRWEMSDINSFISSVINVESVEGVGTKIYNYDTFCILKDGFDYFFDLPNPSDYYLFSVYVFMGYLLPIFNAVPFINLTGTKGCGKTKMLEFLSRVCFNAESSSNTSPSAMFRLIELNSSVILLDESEKLTGIEKDPDIRLLLNACYRRGGTVTRVNKDSHKPERFNVFTTAAIAAQNALEPTLLSRCISRVLIKTATKKGRIEVTDTSFDWQDLRNRLYRFIFTGSERIAEIYNTYDFGNLNCRNLDLWRPILSIALYLDECKGSEEIYPILKTEAEEQEEEQEVLTHLETLTLDVLSEIVLIDDKYFSKDILAGIRVKADEDGTSSALEHVTSTTIASILRKFGFKSNHRERTGKGYPYRIVPEKIEDLKNRYNLIIVKPQ